MLNLDPSKLFVIAVVAIILLGPERLPQVARQAGGAWRSFNDYRRRMESQVRESIPDLPSSAEIARLARSPSALLNHLSAMSPESDGDQPPAAAPEAATTRPAEQGAPSPNVRSAVTPQEPERPAATRAPIESQEPERPVGDPSLN
jgi:Sec-independent protein translocase protein TatA